MDLHLEDLLRSILNTDPQGALEDKHRERLVYATLAVAPTETYEAVWRFANSISDEAKRSFLLHRLSALMAERFEFELSEKIARTVPLPYWQYDSLVKVARELLKREANFRKIRAYQPQHQKDAFRLILEAEKNLLRVPEDDRPSMIWSAGLALADAGELDWAERIATSGQYCPENTEVLLRVARTHAALGNTDRVVQIARTIAELAAACEDQLTHRAYDFGDVGELVLEYGDKTEGIRYFEKAIGLASAIQEAHDVNGSKCLGGLAITLAKHGQVDLAREVANKITWAYHRDWALKKVQEFAVSAQ